MSSVRKLIQQTIATKNFDNAFFLDDIDDIIAKQKYWLSKMRRIKPYYAVKCNNIPIVLEILASLGIGFDCASKNEIADVLSHGVSPSKIIFAHPFKLKSHIEYAMSENVDLMTFDSEEELYKIADCAPDAKLVVRIKADDSYSKLQLGVKFGIDVEKVPRLLQVAKHIGLVVVGVSFHVGSACGSSEPYGDAIEKAAHVFEIAKEYGFNMYLLDIGGGFPGSRDPKDAILFDEIARLVNYSLDRHVPQEMNIEIIAEPGRYYVASAFTLTAMVFAKRFEIIEEQPVMMYYINDGRHGSFPDLTFGKDQVVPIPQIQENHSRTMYHSVIWGPTCNALDCLRTDVMLPEMNIGEWMTLMTQNMGAYTMTLATKFNGFEMPLFKCHASKNAIEFFKNKTAWTRIAKYVDRSNSLGDIVLIILTCIVGFISRFDIGHPMKSLRNIVNSWLEMFKNN